MKFFRFWLPVILWMMVIFAFSGRQKVALTDSYALSFLFFKTLHLIEYIFLYVVCYRAFFNTGMRKDKVFLYAFIITLLYAISDEIHQWFVPTREGRLRDVIIDAIGGGLGWILLTQWLPKAPKKLRNLAKQWQLL
jgi:VanZ family protein